MQYASPAIQLLDFGISIGPKPKPLPKGLSPQECQRLFGVRDAVLMNFIPQMLTALALDEIEWYMEYCRDNRLEDFKRHNRQLRKCIDQYDRDLRRSYGRAWFFYEAYLKRLRAAVNVDIFQSRCVFFNEASRQYVGHVHNEIPAQVTFARLILMFVEDYEKNMDRLIASKLEMPCHRHQDPYLLLISVLCLDVAETFRFQMRVTEEMRICVKVLTNRCRSVAEGIMVDEDTEERSRIDKC